MLIVVMTAYLSFAEARVYCQDSHSTSYFYLGVSCPVNCNNVVAAVKRLKLLDEQATRRSMGKSRRDADETAVFYKICEKIFKNKLNTEELKREIQQEQDKCTLTNIFSKSEVDTATCFRRYYKEEFLKVFTMILNKHAHGGYNFTEEMTSVILEKIIGPSMDDKMTVLRLLVFLKKALTRHKLVALTHAEHITLRAKHCLKTSVPGCYCKAGHKVQSLGNRATNSMASKQCVDGKATSRQREEQHEEQREEHSVALLLKFVEHFGQCVLPTDCLMDGEDLSYMARVHIS